MPSAREGSARARKTPTEGDMVEGEGLVPDAVMSGPLRHADPPVPGRRTWVPRPRLLQMVGQAHEDDPAPIVFVSAAAGAGKSVLAGQWLETDRRVHLKVAGSSGLDEPSALIRALVDLLEQVGPSARNLRASITRIEPRLSTIVLPALERLAASREDDYVLVIDDLHLLRDPGCERVLRAVCTGIPLGSRVLLLSREEAPAWLARTRGEGRLKEITGEDVRFEVDEAAELFRSLEVVSRDVDMNSIVARTEGWAVGLYLTALGMRRTANREFLALGEGHRGGDRFISDYIISEVLLPLDEELQSFLLRTSILDELQPGLCDAVLARNDSRALLAQLQRQLQLVIPLDPDGHRVRYHHLLGEALRFELSRRSPSEVPALHERAARWHERQGDVEEAILHAKAAGDLSEVGRLIWAASGHCIGSGDNDRLVCWLAGLSEPELIGDRWLSLAAAWAALQSGHSDVADRWILRAESHAGAGWRARTPLDGYAAELAVIVALVGRGGVRSTATLCGAALEGLAADSPYRTGALFLRGVALSLSRNIDQGLESLKEAERLARVLGVPLILADALSWQGVLALSAGDLPTARRKIREGTDVVLEHRLERLATAAHCITSQALLLSLTHDAAAGATLNEARRLTAQLGDVAPWFMVCGRLIQARTALSLGESALARQLVMEATSRMTPDLEDSLAQDLREDVERSLAHRKVDGMEAPVLTAAELRVLQFLPSHLQLTQIGEHLFVSANTVKSHVMSIHRKLGVNSRAETVTRARDLGLLEASAYD
jgi:LuxR family transcriptional regulator, maltose regulon positive regulatory protein